MHACNPRSDRDAMMAATALEHGMAMVTRNVADFAGTGAQLVNPFAAVGQPRPPSLGPTSAPRLACLRY